MDFYPQDHFLQGFLIVDGKKSLYFEAAIRCLKVESRVIKISRYIP